MFLEILVLLILVFIVVSSLLMVRYNSSSTKKDREISRQRDERALHQIQRVEHVASQVIKTEQRIMNHLLALGILVDAIELHVGKVDDLVNSDMRAARRDELRRTKELKLAMERLVSSATLSRQQPEGQDLLALDHITNRINELEAIINEDVI